MSKLKFCRVANSTLVSLATLDFGPSFNTLQITIGEVSLSTLGGKV